MQNEISKTDSGCDGEEEYQEDDDGEYPCGVGDSLAVESVAFGEIEETPMRKETEGKDVEEDAEAECQQWEEEEEEHGVSW